jgi:hypothetical protein
MRKINGNDAQDQWKVGAKNGSGGKPGLVRVALIGWLC